jgi:tRNA-dihydrouridine synthase A
VGAHHLPQARSCPGERTVTRPPAPWAPRGGARPLSVAPMMDWTDRHFRRFVREITRHTTLYTEMVTTSALRFGDRERLLAHDPIERPLVLQLGGDAPADLAACAALAARHGFDEVNLNVGCPSERVQRGRFGACLMREPEVVADAVAAMRAATSLPVTVKHRLGVDDLDDDDHLARFVDALVAAGVDGVVVHARKAWLSGLSPKQNRTVPPLQYERVVRLKAARPWLRVELNGGIRDVADAAAWLERVDGVMIGRGAYEDPWGLAEADTVVFGAPAPHRTREAALRAYLPYVEAQRQAGVPLVTITRHLLGLFAGRPGARAFRRVISEGAHRSGAGPEVLERALAAVPPDASAGAPAEASGGVTADRSLDRPPRSDARAIAR